MVRPTPAYRKGIVIHMVQQLQESWTKTFGAPTTTVRRENKEKDNPERPRSKFKTLFYYTTSLENEIYDRFFLLDCIDAYRHKTASLLFNLQHNGAHLFVAHTPNELVKLTDDELSTAHPSVAGLHEATAALEEGCTLQEYYPVCIARRLDSLQPRTLGQSNEIVTTLDELKKKIPGALGLETRNTLLKCNRCPPGTIVEWFGKQSRGADEGETIRAICTGCGKRWRET
jgi:DNA-directed RNA polymerase subunit M/transcription elongation factor TFIIS